MPKSRPAAQKNRPAGRGGYALCGSAVTDFQI